MSEITISQRTYSGIDRLLNRIDKKLNREILDEAITEKQAAEWLEVSIGRLRNMVGDGTIPRNAYEVLVNGTKKFYKDKLIKK